MKRNSFGQAACCQENKKPELATEPTSMTKQLFFLHVGDLLSDLLMIFKLIGDINQKSLDLELKEIRLKSRSSLVEFDVA
jgi:hypothetical protein